MNAGVSNNSVWNAFSEWSQFPVLSTPAAAQLRFRTHRPNARKPLPPKEQY